MGTLTSGSWTERSVNGIATHECEYACLGQRSKTYLKDLMTVRDSSPNSVLILHGGVNDVGNTPSEELINTYRTVIVKLGKSRRRGFITSILPKIGAGMEWSSRAIGINDRVET